ncbi:hypothetical protein ACR9EG_13550, partial [Lactococcus lactis]|uniref:hypothetical protein n=2 Tax=Bacillati TaxID=1783272 RepID=UPI003EB8802A
LWYEYDASEAKAAYAMVREMFPEPRLDGFDVIGGDWLGRQFGQPWVFDPAEADFYEMDYETVDEAVAEDPNWFLRTDL